MKKKFVMRFALLIMIIVFAACTNKGEEKVIFTGRSTFFCLFGTLGILSSFQLFSRFRIQQATCTNNMHGNVTNEDGQPES